MIAFRLNYDYRCPWTGIVHDTVLDGLDAGADWDVRFEPYSLSQSHVTDGESPIWDRPEDDSGLEALEVSVVVRDRFPEAFRTVHRGLLGLRHHRGLNLDRSNISGVLNDAGLSAADVWPGVDDGSALAVVRDEHETQVKDHDVWGVPTFMVGPRAVFVRFLERSDGDGDLAIRRVTRVLSALVDDPNLNEFKHTSLDH
ncbi:MAG: protein-disulfide isomerase [Actinobacteria bacterium]|nr:protein-disulfide isomerase [Actinomycetota bacterium]